ncbi:MAG TPA: hypothetical protein PLY57_02055 [Deltaproteobacteria bacterium]|nr:hypothetical protein [Deltaproteobacteria bacterium]
MWVKLLSALILLVLIVGIGYIARDGDQEQADAGGPGTGTGTGEQPSRAAGGIVMYETKPDSGSSLVIHAASATEDKDRVVVLEEFRLEQSNGLRLTGDRARYDADRSLLDIIGPVRVNTADGWQADLDGLTWDRKTKKASTDKPLVVKGAQGTITADRGEFFDDFNRILLAGDVHANLSPHLLHR